MFQGNRYIGTIKTQETGEDQERHNKRFDKGKSMGKICSKIKVTANKIIRKKSFAVNHLPKTNSRKKSQSDILKT